MGGRCTSTAEEDEDGADGLVLVFHDELALVELYDAACLGAEALMIAFAFACGYGFAFAFAFAVA